MVNLILAIKLHTLADMDYGLIRRLENHYR